MQIRQELLEKVFPEAVPLFLDQCEEMGYLLTPFTFDYRPGVLGWIEAERRGKLLMLTVREVGERLIGYNIMLAGAPKPLDVVVSQSVAFYIRPHFRHGFLVRRLLKESEQLSKVMKAGTMFYNPRDTSRFGELLQVSGYKQVAREYERTL